MEDAKIQQVLQIARQLFDKDGYHAPMFFMFVGDNFIPAVLEMTSIESKIRIGELFKEKVKELKPDMIMMISEAYATSIDQNTGATSRREILSVLVETENEQRTYSANITRVPGVVRLESWTIGNDVSDCKEKATGAMSDFYGNSCQLEFTKEDLLKMCGAKV